MARLKRKNSGADKPLVYIEKNLDGIYNTVKDIIDENTFYGEFKNISLFDDISLIGKPYNFHQIQNDYAFNYQYYLYKEKRSCFLPA